MRKKKVSVPEETVPAAPKETTAQAATPSPAPTSPAPEVRIPDVPSVWREAGYLVLVYAIRAGEVYYLSCNYGARSASFPRFFDRMTRQMADVNPHHLILNLLVRKRNGTFDMRVREERKLTAMLNRDELSKMSERELARCYTQVMGAGPQRIATAKREQCIDEMIAKLTADAAKPTEDDPAASATTVGEVSEKKAKKGAKAAKKAKAPKEPKAAKAPKEPKAPKSAKTPKAPKAPKEPKVKDPNNPYRAGSMKHKCYEQFKKVKGDRKASVSAMIDAGAKESTASSWYNAFAKHSSTN